MSLSRSTGNSFTLAPFLEIPPRFHETTEIDCLGNNPRQKVEVNSSVPDQERDSPQGGLRHRRKGPIEDEQIYFVSHDFFNIRCQLKLTRKFTILLRPATLRLRLKIDGNIKIRVRTDLSPGARTKKKHQDDTVFLFKIVFQSGNHEVLSTGKWKWGQSSLIIYVTAMLSFCSAGFSVIIRSMGGVSLSMTKDLIHRMVAEGLITEDQLAVAQVSQESLGQDLERILVKKGFITEDQLLTFLARSLQMPYVHLKKGSVQPELVQKVPFHVARRYHLIPLRQEGPVLVVAMSDPLNRFALDDIRAATHSEIKPVLASSDEIDFLIDHFYATKTSPREKGFKSAKSGESGEPAESIGETAEYFFEETAEIGGEKLAEIATGPRIVQTVNQIIMEAWREKASDVHIEPWRDSILVRYRIYGFLEERQRLPRELLLPVVSRIKILGGLDIAERRAPQDGRVRMRCGGKDLDIRVATYPTVNGEKVVLRLLSRDSIVGIDSLGFSEKDRKIFTELIAKNHGIFLVTGPTGSGKSTTLYAALSRINSPEKNIISIEDPVESEISGVNQAQINPKANVTFASALRAILRQDPNVIMIGEIRDAETAEIAVRAAITGHLVLSTLHTNTAAGALSRLIDLGVQPFLISTSLIGVLAQRLVRKVCTLCRKEIDPSSLENPKTLVSLGIHLDRCFVGQGCDACRRSGYSGRVGIFEMAPTGESIRKKISERCSDTEIEKEFRRLDVHSMLEDGLDKVRQGITTIDEVLRVTQED